MVVVRVLGGHIMKLNHSTDYKQLKLLCRSMRKLERKGVGEGAVVDADDAGNNNGNN